MPGYFAINEINKLCSEDKPWPHWVSSRDYSVKQIPNYIFCRVGHRFILMLVFVFVLSGIFYQVINNIKELI